MAAACKLLSFAVATVALILVRRFVLLAGSIQLAGSEANLDLCQSFWIPEWS